MTILMKLTSSFAGATLPPLPHGTGVTTDNGEVPYRWLAGDLAGSPGTVINSWPESKGNGVLAGSSAAATRALVSGYDAVSFDGSGALSIATTAPLPVGRGSICGVARLAPEAIASTQYSLLSFFNTTTSLSSADGRVLKASDGKVLFDRLSTSSANAKAAASLLPGGYFTFGISNAAGGSYAMLNGVTLTVGAGNITEFQRFFLGTTGSGLTWLGSVFEVDAWTTQLNAAQLIQFHEGMKAHYSFLA
jgi:hypothetical protein